jgi:hypothetical protein
MTLTHKEPVIPRALMERASNLIRRPTAEWAVIDAEPATVQGLYRGYLLWLAAIGPVCWFVGAVLFLRAGIAGALVSAVVMYLASLVGAAVAGLVLDALAPRFGGEANRVQAFKVAVYAPTPSLLAGVFMLVPPLSILGVVGLYSLYVLWVGAPRLMRVPPARAAAFYGVFILAMIGVGIVIGLIMSPLMWSVRYGL